MLKLLKPSEIEVLSLAEVKAHLRLDHTCEDDYLKTLIQAATQSIEHSIEKSLIVKCWQLIWKPSSIRSSSITIPLLYPPLYKVISVKKIISRHYQPLIENYFLETDFITPRLICPWTSHSIEIIYQSGYGETPKSIPADIRQAILIKIADLYENRTSHSLDHPSNSEMMIRDLLKAYRNVGLR